MNGATIAEALAQATARLAAAGVEAPRRDARLLLATHLDRDEAWLIANDGEDIVSPEAYDRLVDRRAAREPVSRIVGRREFWSLDFEIAPDVLDPRADSECVVETALGALANPAGRYRIVDIGTGSGCLLLSLLYERPGARGLGTDLSLAALHCASANAVRLGIGARARFVRCDWATAIDSPVDLLISNPPYIPRDEIAGLAPEVRQFDPELALIGGDDGLDAYRAILTDAPRLLRHGGTVVLEIGAGQSQAVGSLLRSAGFADVSEHRDLAGHVRAICARMGSDPK